MIAEQRAAEIIENPYGRTDMLKKTSNRRLFSKISVEAGDTVLYIADQTDLALFRALRLHRADVFAFEWSDNVPAKSNAQNDAIRSRFRTMNDIPAKSMQTVIVQLEKTKKTTIDLDFYYSLLKDGGQIVLIIPANEIKMINRMRDLFRNDRFEDVRVSLSLPYVIISGWKYSLYMQQLIRFRQVYGLK